MKVNYVINDIETLLPLFKMSDLEQKLQDAQDEILRLRKVLAASNKKGITITYPLPQMNANALTHPEKLEEIKNIYSGVVLEMINTISAKFAMENRKVYGFLEILPESKEFSINFAEFQ